MLFYGGIHSQTCPLEESSSGNTEPEPRGRLLELNSMGVRAALAFLLLFVATVTAADGGVTFSRETFTMTCPQEGTWFKDQESIQDEATTYTSTYNGKSKGFYHCKYTAGKDKEIKYYFYVKGSVCANCFELNPTVIVVVIIMNVVGTACMMAIIYRCTKKKSSAGLTQASKAPARSGGGPPLLYESLNPHTRSQDQYSVVNRMG